MKLISAGMGDFDSEEVKLSKYTHDYELDGPAVPELPPTFTLEFDLDGEHHVEDFTDDVEAFNRSIDLIRKTVRTKVTITKKWGNRQQVVVFTRRGMV